MQDILYNLAFIDTLKFCKENGIDCAGSHLVKNGRGFKYSLVRDEDGRGLVTVIFHKDSVPTHYTQA
jgi:hypothetical protein